MKTMDPNEDFGPVLSVISTEYFVTAQIQKGYVNIWAAGRGVQAFVYKIQKQT